MTDAQRLIVTSLAEYKTFTILDKPIKFSELMNDRNFDRVELHLIETYNTGQGHQDIIGFCGAFSWLDNNLEPLDGDSYNRDVLVHGYEEFETNNKQQCIAILVGNDW